MLPKRSSKKSSSDAQQLQLDQAQSTAKKQSRKQKILFVTLALTIGLSIAFSLFYRLSSSQFHLPQINLPLPFSSSARLSSKLAPLLDHSSTSVYVQTIPNTFSDHYPDSFSLPSSQIDSLVSTLSSLPFSSHTALPSGCQVQQQSVNHQLQLLITVPQKQILIIIDQPPPQPQLDSIIATLYWHTINF